MHDRRGTTLIEVLVAIFVMAIGMLTLLILFPLGALNMAQAIKDDRTAHTAANAKAIANLFKMRLDPTVQSHLTANTSGLPATTSGPSYPVYVDPIGFVFSTPSVGTNPFAATRPASKGFDRIGFTWLSGTTAKDNTRWLTLLDDITFENNAVPAPGNPVAANLFPRDDRYSVAYLFQLPDITKPTTTINMTVVVYSGRPQLQAEATYLADYSKAKTLNVITIYPQQGPPIQEKPNIRNGTWILDSTMEDNSALPAGAPNPHGFFYRVVNVTDNGTSLDVEVQNPLRGYGFFPTVNTTTNPYNGLVTVMDGVSEIFEVGP